MVSRIHLCQDTNAELVSAHAGFDPGVVAQTLEEFLRTRRAWKVVEREDGLESVGCLILGFLPITMSIRGHRFDGRVGGPRAGVRRREGGELGGRWRKKDYLLGFEGIEGERIRKWGFDNAKLRSYHEFLVGCRNK